MIDSMRMNLKSFYYVRLVASGGGRAEVSLRFFAARIIQYMLENTLYNKEYIMNSI